MNEDSYFETTDLALSALLECKGFPIENIRSHPTKPSKSIFIFKDSEKLRELIRDFYNDKTLVPALTFFNTVKKIKIQINSFT